MKRGKKNTKTDIAAIFTFFMFVLAGFVVGFLGETKLFPSGNDFKFEYIVVLIALLIFWFAFFIQIILHEGGHLIFGLLSGYEFISFRIGSLTIVKEDEKLKFKKFKIRGTAGQCLMMPTVNSYEECPYVLYNLGGVIINIITSILALVLYYVAHGNSYINALLISLAVSGILCVITNGIPMKVGGVANDAYNVVSISKNKFMKYCFYIQLKVNGLLHKGIRFKDMPFEWFIIDEGADYNNPLVTSLKCFEANYYHDMKEFKLAKKSYEDLLEKAPNILKFYEYEANCELLFYEIIGERREDRIAELYNKELKNYIKATTCYIARKRLMYAYNLIIEKDIDKVNKVLREVEKVKKTYPAKAEVECEVEIIEFVKNKFESLVSI